MQNGHVLGHVNKGQYIWDICCFRLQNGPVLRLLARSRNVQNRGPRTSIRFWYFGPAKQPLGTMQLRRG